jgi:tRNA1(Val) A37 N6-methylase TrmN6
MLLLAREKTAYCEAYEVQEEYADLIERNARLNKLEERLKSVHTDIRELENTESFDLVFTNPPYMKADSGKQNTSDKKSFARHEHHGDIEDFCITAKKLLKFGGAFYAVYRPDRLTDIFFAMRRSGLEPKRATFVHANTKSEASMVLIEAKRGGKSGMMLTKPLIIYKDETNKEYGNDMQYIMEKGSFPEEFKR